MASPSRWKGYAMVLGSALCWGLSGGAAQALFQRERVQPAWLVTVRMLAAGPLLLLMGTLRTGPARGIFAIWGEGADRRRLLLFAVAGMLAVQFTFFAAIGASNAATATLLQSLAPVFILALTALRQRRFPGARERVAVALALGGTALLVTGGSLDSLRVTGPALAWGLGSALALVFYLLYPRELMERWGSSTLVGWAMVVGGLGLSLVCPPWHTGGLHASATALGLVLFVVLLGTVLPFYLYMESLRHLTAMETSLLGSAEPLSAVLVSVLWLHTPFGPWELLGGLGILSTVLILATPPGQSGYNLSKVYLGIQSISFLGDASMGHHLKRRRAILGILCACLVLGGAGVYLKISRDLSRALDQNGRAEAPLQFVEVPAPGLRGEVWGGGEVEGVAATEASLTTAGAFGVRDETGEVSGSLPTLQASCLTLWRGRPVTGLVSGGLFLRTEGQWQELVTGFGTLHARALAETAGGELLIGAREGLFRAAWGSRTLTRLDGNSVRALAQGDGVLLAGGEEGLRRIEAGRVTPLATPDPWIDAVALAGDQVLVVTPLGLARGPLGGAQATGPGALTPLAGGEDTTSVAPVGNQVLAVGGGHLLRFGPEGRGREEYLPSPPRKLFTAAGQIFVDTEAGLYRRAKEGWVLARPRPAGLPSGCSHLSALAWLGPRLVAGIFNGGLVVGEVKGASLAWSPVPGARTWGVNALLPAGGSLQVASLRGVARFDGRNLSAPTGDGAAFALASTRNGVAVGYGQGVLLPGSRLLSAFHGLPGNQALALAAGEALFVGTPSGLGAVYAGRVAWRVTAGEGRLPHPWITALALFKGQLIIGTYGGGTTRREVSAAQPLDVGTFTPFLETGSLKVNAGCLVEAAGRLYLGSDGQGLWRLAPDGSRFTRLHVQLPSPRVTAILEGRDALFVGTDEGLTRLALPLPDEER